MKIIPALMVVMLLGACASAGRTSDCAYRNLVGKSVHSAEVTAVQQSGKNVRLLYPDSYLGFKSDPNRVNLIHDDNDLILAVTCG